MVDFLISYKNNFAKIGKRNQAFKLKSFNLSVLTTENNELLLTENDVFLDWDQTDRSSLVYRFLDIDTLPSSEIDVNRIIYGD
jgi:hypothetical protein